MQKRKAFFLQEPNNFKPFFLYQAKEWSKLSEENRNIDLIKKCKYSFLNVPRPRVNSVFAADDITKYTKYTKSLKIKLQAPK